MPGSASPIATVLRRPVRLAASANTRINWNRWAGLEPDGFAALHSSTLRGIEGWRYRQDLALLFALARDLPGDGVTLEIGSFKGLATTALAMGCHLGGRAGVHTVDPHTGDRQDLDARGIDERPSLEDFRMNIAAAGVDHLVTSHVMTSDDLSLCWDAGGIRLLFVDGWHSYDAVRSDLANWVPRCDPGSVVVVDDYRNYPEVAQAVDDSVELPAVRERAGRMIVAHGGELPHSARRMLRLPWG